MDSSVDERNRDPFTAVGDSTGTGSKCTGS